MKWFKHMVDAHDDERMALLRDLGGFEATGFYWWLLEVIAKQVDEKDVAEVEYPLNHWRRISGYSAKKFHNMAELCSRVGLVSAETHGKLLKIKCPTLLKIRDNHTKNLQAKNKSKEEDKEVVVVSARAPEINAPPESLFSQLQEIINSPIPLNMERVRVWLANGATEALIVETVRRLMAPRQCDPPSTMNYFEKAVAQAVANQNRPMEKQNARNFHNKPTKLDIAAEGIARAAAKREQRRREQAGQPDDGLHSHSETLRT